MAWTSLGTVTAGEVLTAAYFNTVQRSIESGLPIVTTTQRNALASPSVGTEVYNSTTGSFEMYNGSTWQISRPFAMAAGFQYGGAGATAITFPSGRFSVTPLLIVKNQENVQLTVTASSSTGFTWQNAVGSNNTMVYSAIQMTATSAAG